MPLNKSLEQEGEIMPGATQGLSQNIFQGLLVFLII